MNEILLSIIIPVFNAAMYITDCVTSLKNKKNKYVEILLVNDGSTDNSLDVCHNLAKKNRNIKVIDSENKGVSAARNLGILNARGKWILFVDADDYLEVDSIDYIIEHLPEEKNIMCHFGMYKDYYRNDILYESKKLGHALFSEKNSNYKKVFSINDDFYSMFKNNVFDSACLCLFNNSIIKNNEILFVDGMKVREDTEFLLHYLNVVEFVEIWNRFLYHYRIDGDEKYSLRREVEIEDIEVIASRYMKTLSNVRKEKKSAEKEVSYFVYQLFYGGVVHIAQNKSKKYLEVKKYANSMINNLFLYNIIVASVSCNKFHKMLLFLLKKRWSGIFSLVCCLRL